jgi:DNA-binding IclR family transcriptional regulator
MVKESRSTEPPDDQSWTFLTNHTHVLLCVAQEPDIRLSKIATMVGIGERAAHRIIHELETAGYLRVSKVGRRNVYDIDLDRPLRHPLESHRHIRSVLAPLVEGGR